MKEKSPLYKFMDILKPHKKLLELYKRIIELDISDTSGNDNELIELSREFTREGVKVYELVKRYGLIGDNEEDQIILSNYIENECKKIFEQ